MKWGNVHTKPTRFVSFGYQKMESDRNRERQVVQVNTVHWADIWLYKAGIVIVYLVLASVICDVAIWLYMAGIVVLYLVQSGLRCSNLVWDVAAILCVSFHLSVCLCAVILWWKFYFAINGLSIGVTVDRWTIGFVLSYKVETRTCPKEEKI